MSGGGYDIFTAGLQGWLRGVVSDCKTETRDEFLEATRSSSSTVFIRFHLGDSG